MSSGEKVASRYDKWSYFYDMVDNFPVISRPQQNWRMDSIEALDLEGDELVLDVGTGSGYMLPDIARRIDDGQVFGSDISDGMLYRAKRRAELEGVDDRVKTINDNIEDSRFPSAHFDKLLTTFTLTTVPDPMKAIKECHRILRDEGRMVVLDTGEPSNGLSKLFFYPMMLSAKVFGRTHMDRDIRGALKKHFDIVESSEYMCGMVYLLCCEKK